MRPPRLFHWRPVLSACAVGLFAVACSSDPATQETPADTTSVSNLATAGDAEPLSVEVLSTAPHDAGAFTQGLLIEDGTLYESTGLNGQSTVREVDLASGEVLRSRDVDAAFFAEGLELVDGQLIQLTWKAQRAFIYDAETFEPQGQYTYETEGWGLCAMPDLLVMSDGSSTLTMRDRSTFEVLNTVEVRRSGTLVTDLNELECVGGDVWANVWQTDEILRIDPTTGVVTGVVDAAGLLAAEEAQSADVLNGIAFDESTDTFWITGKYWPTMFEVRFAAAA